MVQAGGRAAIQAELLTLASENFALWDSLETVIDEPEKKYTAKQIFPDDGVAVTLIKWRCDGLTEEKWAQWETDPLAVAAAINPKMTVVPMADDEGHRLAHIKMSMPMLISNRSTITCFYRTEKEDGSKILMHSSKGNDSFVTGSQATEIGSDVVANNVITYMSWKPYDGGIEIEHAIKMDPAGMIPGFLKNKAATRMAKNLQLIVDYLINGTIPAPIF